jgi:CubicO group peptidase (beta-lactamase class C family)
MPGVGLITWALNYRVDRMRKDVTVTLFGLGRSHAVYREGMGCYLDHGGVAADVSLPAAFAEPERPPFRHTRAVVVVKDGHVVAERYAEGYGIETPLLGFSATKSVISALTGILVRKGALTLDQPVPIAAWQGAGDPRHAITVNHLLRHTAGLAIGSSLEASLGAAFEPVNRTKFMESDMAAYAESIELATPPGSAWNYNDGNFIIPSHLIRNATGGQASDVMRFARQELFAPLGMRNVTLEFDASGNPEGSSQMLATARDWARFGMLYLNDGVVGGKRILPEGWVKYSASPTPNGWVGYGAGFWTNLGDSFGANCRIEHGRPRDAFFAKGTIEQYVLIVPSERLVICGSAGRRIGRRRSMACPISSAMSSRQPAARKWRCGARLGVAFSKRMTFAATGHATM